MYDRLRAGPLVASTVLALVCASAAWAQNATEDDGEEAEVGMTRVSSWGEGLTDANALDLLQEMRIMVEEALATSRAAENASTIGEIRTAAEYAFAMVWGRPSGTASGAAGELAEHGWKERWQVTGEEFDEEWIERLGTEPPTITDPRGLGAMGRGRAVRGRLESVTEGSAAAFAEPDSPAAMALASLNNIIGWTYLTTGLKVREVQPRVSLTHVWDAPAEFWRSSADTGWLSEVYSQAANILKTRYAAGDPDDLAAARRHVSALTGLLEKVLAGVDADGDGIVEARAMEGGLDTAVDALVQAGRRVTTE